MPGYSGIERHSHQVHPANSPEYPPDNAAHYSLLIVVSLPSIGFPQRDLLTGNSLPMYWLQTAKGALMEPLSFSLGRQCLVDTVRS